MSASSSHTEREGFLCLAFVTTSEPRGAWTGNEGTPFLPPNIVCHNCSILILTQTPTYQKRVCLFITSWSFSITGSSCGLGCCDLDHGTCEEQTGNMLKSSRTHQIRSRIATELPFTFILKYFCAVMSPWPAYSSNVLVKAADFKNLLKVLCKSQSHYCSIMQRVWLQNTCTGVAERF